MLDKNIFHLTTIPMRGHLFLFEELERRNISFAFFHYDYFQTPDPEAVCRYREKEYWGTKMLFIKSALTQKEIFSLLDGIRDEKGISFS